jgi:hypothetical protein
MELSWPAALNAEETGISFTLLFGFGFPEAT